MENSRLYTEKEVEKILQNQRGNCYVAILTKTRDEELAKIAGNAPEPGMWNQPLSHNSYEGFDIPGLAEATKDFQGFIHDQNLSPNLIGYLIGIYVKNSRTVSKSQ